MGDVSNEQVKEFSKRMNACMKRVGGGKVAMDTICLRKLVREERETAYRVAELYCLMAQSNKEYFQGAMAIAAAYQVEFNDTSLLEKVTQQAKD